MKQTLAAEHHQLHKELTALRHCLKLVKDHGFRGEFITTQHETFKHLRSVKCSAKRNLMESSPKKSITS
jgi:hypothetical protein